MGGIGIKQHDSTDCGPACLASVFAHYGLGIPISKLRQRAGTDMKGTNILGLIETAEKYGFLAKGVRGDSKSLQGLPLPAIAHIQLRTGIFHYVVIYGISKKGIRLMDPGTGRLRFEALPSFRERWTGVLLLLLPGPKFSPSDEKVALYRRFWYLIKPNRSLLIQALFGAVAYTLLGFSTAIYLQKITDQVLIGNNIGLLNILSLCMLFILVAQTIFEVYKDLFVLECGQQIDLRLIMGYYRHLLSLPKQFFDNMKTGEILARINDAVKIRFFLNEISLNLLVNLLILGFSILLMLSYYWKLALIILLMMPLYGLIYIIVNTLNRQMERKVILNAAELEGKLVESLNSMGTIKYFGLERRTADNTEEGFIKFLNSAYTSSLNRIFAGSGSAFLSKLITLLLLWSGSYFVMHREISPGELLSFYAIVGYFTSPVAGIIGANREFQNAVIAATRLFEIIDLEQEEVSGCPLSDTRGDIQFRDVSFKYGSRTEVFQNFNLLIPGGKITAIVGESGSGKSTLIHLLQKLYPLQRGCIRLGETDLAYVNTASLRSRMGLVPQKIDLLAGDFIENISLGAQEPDIGRIIRICHEIGILDFIEKLPAGLQTFLGEDGVLLSGGQRQRLAFARALYRQPGILLLDEASSSLDSVSEEHIRRVVQRLREKGITIVLVAHRLSSVIHADKIVVLHNGLVAEEGTHSELFSKQGKYYELWERQMPAARLHGQTHLP